MKKQAFAKINLTLDVTGVMPDGYHSLFTVMTSVKCADVIEVSLRSDGRTVLSANKSYIPLDGSNTCSRAAALFARLTGAEDGCEIYIENRVPSGAGLGNSSADAAAVLRALNELHGFPLDDVALCRASVGVGADVPFCYAGGTRLCLGKGDEMSVLPDFDYPVLIVKPEESFPTAGAYARIDASPGLVHPDNGGFLSAAEAGDYRTALTCAGNVFEQVMPAETINVLKERLIRAGAFYSAMSGSGSAVFGVFGKETPPASLERAAAAFESDGCFAFVSA